MSKNLTMVVALAALYGNALASEEDVQWFLSGATSDLSNDLTELSALGPGGYFALHSPFLVAREALSGRLSLVDAANEVLGQPVRPILLTEDFGPDIANRWLVTRAADAGLALDGTETSDDFAAAITTYPENEIANLLAYRFARAQNDVALAAVAAHARGDAGGAQCPARHADAARLGDVIGAFSAIVGTGFAKENATTGNLERSV
ncbi:MAG: hypothetical protein HC900_12965 [Methylacidiphilales bacterium]|nr:hypothetical protein [Candidatus Methylacidiphilales bacterium]